MSVAATRAKARDATADVEVHVVCADSALAARLEHALVADSLPIASRVASAEALELPPDTKGRTVVVVASSESPTRRVGVVRALAERRRVRVVAIRATGLAEVRRTIQAGAYGYVLEREIETALAPTVRAALAGQIALPKEERMQVGAPSLSAREREVLGLAIRGDLNHDIAKQLFLAESTVKSHLSSAFLKLGVRSRSEAIELIRDGSHDLGRWLGEIRGEADQHVVVPSVVA